MDTQEMLFWLGKAEKALGNFADSSNPDAADLGAIYSAASSGLAPAEQSAFAEKFSLHCLACVLNDPALNGEALMSCVVPALAHSGMDCSPAARMMLESALRAFPDPADPDWPDQIFCCGENLFLRLNCALLLLGPGDRLGRADEYDNLSENVSIPRLSQNLAKLGPDLLRRFKNIVELATPLAPETGLCHSRPFASFSCAAGLASLIEAACLGDCVAQGRGRNPPKL